LPRETPVFFIIFVDELFAGWGLPRETPVFFIIFVDELFAGWGCDDFA
jgi:hypothetical protein